MRVFVTGAGGQLGSDVMNELAVLGYEAVGSDIYPASSVKVTHSGLLRYIRLDITNKDGVARALEKIQPDAVIHCAAWTNVDAAEDVKNRINVWRINVLGTENLAEMCAQLGCKMMYISTDYVFSGEGTKPWTEVSETAPLNYYGISKLKGEKLVSSILEKYYILRTSWTFGSKNRNFLAKILAAAGKNDSLRVVDDQIGTPTYTVDLARLMVDMIETEKYGYYHVTNEGGFASRYEIVCELLKQAGYNTRVVPVSTEAFSTVQAIRPKNSRLDKGKLIRAGFTPLPTWQDAIARYLKEAKL